MRLPPLCARNARLGERSSSRSACSRNDHWRDGGDTNGEAQTQDPKGPARSSGRASRRRFGTRAGGSDSYSALSLHALFEQQTRQLLDRADLDEEQKQNILVAMSCPCCGAGAMSFTAKLKR
jgi:hypothetical protein